MADIEWKTYIEPVRHREVVQITEENAVDFCREFGLGLEFYEVKVPPHPTGRAMRMRVRLESGFRRDPVDVPFWVQRRGASFYQMNSPKPDWTEES